ncbi:DUF6083 domain-containing protein [Streptomyces sp. SCL15-4]|uniref:DUF6083 domain-containing protein n=1 Tax=Streptomyces sp. SCL15-4 TaxID=2967221 RepID=UPI00398FDCF1
MRHHNPPAGRHRDGSPRHLPPRRSLQIATHSPSRLLRAGQTTGRCRHCGNRIDWYPRSEGRLIALHPAEVATTSVSAAYRWHLSSGVAYPHDDASGWCRIPHAALCPPAAIKTPHRQHPPYITASRTRPALQTSDRHRRPHPGDPPTRHCRAERTRRTTHPPHRPDPPRQLPRRKHHRDHPLYRPDHPTRPLHTLPHRSDPRTLGPAAHPADLQPTRPAQHQHGGLRPQPPALHRTTTLAHPTLHRSRRLCHGRRPDPGHLEALRPSPARPIHPHRATHARKAPPSSTVTEAHPAPRASLNGPHLARKPTRKWRHRAGDAPERGG